MYCKQRKAFTQIELIFVILVAAILGAVAIPRLAASRDDAKAAKCTQEVQQLIAEISQTYATKGYRLFSVMPIKEITNLRASIIEKDGISSPGAALVENGINYMCDSENIITIQGNVAGVEYNLTVTDLNPTTPAAVTASELIRKLHDISTAGGSKTYRLQ